FDLEIFPLPHVCDAAIADGLSGVMDRFALRIKHSVFQRHVNFSQHLLSSFQKRSTCMRYWRLLAAPRQKTCTGRIYLSKQLSYSDFRAGSAPLYLSMPPKTRSKMRSTFLNRARASKTFSICPGDSFDAMSGSCLTNSRKSKPSSHDFRALRCTQ